MKTLIERLGSASHISVHLAEIADAMLECYRNNDAEGIHALKRAYIKGLRLDDTRRTAGEMIACVRNTFSSAASMANTVDRIGARSAAGVVVMRRFDAEGPVTEFYIDALCAGSHDYTKSDSQ